MQYIRLRTREKRRDIGRINRYISHFRERHALEIREIPAREYRARAQGKTISSDL